MLFKLINSLPKLAFLLLKQLYDYRNQEVEFLYIPLVAQARRFSKNEKSIRRAYKYLEALGFVKSRKGVGECHVTERWITLEGFTWVENHMSDVMSDVSPPTTIRSLIPEKRDQEILENDVVHNEEEFGEEQDRKLIEYRLNRFQLPVRAKRQILSTAISSGLRMSDVLEVTARVHRASLKTPLQYPQAYFHKAIENHVSSYAF